MSSEIFVASVPHETNTFVSETTNRKEFQRRGEFFGADVLDELKGTNTPIGGILNGLDTNGFTPIPSVVARVLAGGPVAVETFEFYFEQIEEDLKNAGNIDGVALHLHGAMVVADGRRGESTIVKRVREIVGSDVPIAATLDLHGNIDDELLNHADILVCYETYPHMDTGATGENAIKLLTQTLDSEITPTMHIERLPLYPSITSQTTQGGPMKDVMASARKRENIDDVLKINVFAGFFGADVPKNTLSILTVTDDDQTLAREVGQNFGSEIWAAKNNFNPDEPSPREAITEAKSHLNSGSEGPVVLAEVADNPGGGAPGDETTLLQELLYIGDLDIGFAIMHDPDAIEKCMKYGVRENISLELGGAKSDTISNPISVDGRIKTITDGRFIRTGPVGTGSQCDFGQTVVIECGPANNVSVVLTGTRMQPSDAEIWRHIGIPPERLDVIGLKSANHYRGSYAPLASTIVSVDTPGVMPIDPSHLDFEHRPEKVYPIDDMGGTYESF